MKRMSSRLAALLLVSFAYAANCVASPIPIMGVAKSDMDADQSLTLLLFQPLDSGRFMNWGNGPSTPAACDAGSPCHFTQTTLFFTPSYSPPYGIDYGYDLAFANLFFDMTTTDPVNEADLDPQTQPQVSMFATGTVTGTLGFYDCAGTGCVERGWSALYKGCTDSADCPIPIQSCGDEYDANCTFAVSGIAEGYTGVVGPRPNRTLDFMGTANLVPEPSSLLLMSSGLLGIGGLLRLKLRP